MSRAAILLKSPPHDAADAYVEHFSSAGYTPYFIRVLESVSVNDQTLEDIVCTGPSVYAGVAITSSRAVEAWVKACQNAKSLGSIHIASIDCTQALNYLLVLGNWTRTPFYVVGEATASALNRNATSHPTNFSTSLILGASHSGNSESLAEFVLADLLSRGSKGGRLLYLTGDKNRVTFQRIMSEGGVEVENLRIYETLAASDLHEQIKCVACEIEKGALHLLPHEDPIHDFQFRGRRADVVVDRFLRAFIIRLRTASSSPVLPPARRHAVPQR